MPFNDKHVLPFRFEAFNIMNHPVGGNPNTNLASATFAAGSLVPRAQNHFGIITGTRTNRRNLHLAL